MRAKRILAIAFPFLQQSFFLGLGYVKYHLLKRYIPAMKNVLAQNLK